MSVYFIHLSITIKVFLHTLLQFYFDCGPNNPSTIESENKDCKYLKTLLIH